MRSRYFDRGAPSRLQATAETGSQELAQRTQYAALSVALLHFRLGDLALSQQSVLEAIHLAQQHGDALCLLHALALLCRLALVRGETALARTLLTRCVHMARALHSPPLGANASAEADSALATSMTSSPSVMTHTSAAAVALQMSLLLAQLSLDHAEQVCHLHMFPMVLRSVSHLQLLHHAQFSTPDSSVGAPPHSASLDALVLRLTHGAQQFAKGDGSTVTCFASSAPLN